MPQCTTRARGVSLGLVQADDRERVHIEFARALESGEPRRIEHRIVRPDGAVRVLETHIEPERDEGGAIVRVIGSAQDITERRHLEEQLREAQKLEAIGRLAADWIEPATPVPTASLTSRSL